MSFLSLVAIIAVGVALLVAGLASLAASSRPGWTHVGTPSLAISGTDLVVAYMAHGGPSAVFVTKVDESLDPIFRHVQASPRFGISIYPRSPSVKADPAGGIHILWTLYDIRGFNDCQISLHYSRLSPLGERLIEDRDLGVERAACDPFDVNWTIGSDGNPVILGFDGGTANETLQLFNLTCSSNCQPSVARAPDGTLYAATAIARSAMATPRTEVTYTHVALYAYHSEDVGVERIAILISNDPMNPVTLPSEPFPILLFVAGAVLVASGALAFLLAWKAKKRRF